MAQALGCGLQKAVLQDQPLGLSGPSSKVVEPAVGPPAWHAMLEPVRPQPNAAAPALERSARTDAAHARCQCLNVQPRVSAWWQRLYVLQAGHRRAPGSTSVPSPLT